jgi:hypothetical protein
LKRAERRIKETQGEEASVAIFSSQQAVLDLILATGGSPDVLNSANSEELLQAVTSTAQEAGRIAERKIANEQIEDANSQIAARNQEIEEASEKIQQLAIDKVIADGLLRRKEEEISTLVETENVRLNEIANQIIKDARSQSWMFVGSLWVALALYGVLGQFFIWNGLEWWEASDGHKILGGTVIISTLMAAMFSLRFIPPGHVDLIGSIHNVSAKIRARMLIKQIRYIPDRNAVLDRIEDEEYIQSLKAISR